MENKEDHEWFYMMFGGMLIIFTLMLIAFIIAPEVNNSQSQIDKEAVAYEQNYKAKNGPLIEAVANGQRKQASIVLETNRAKTYNENLNDKITELNQMGIKVTQVSLGANNEATLIMIEKDSDQ